MLPSQPPHPNAARLFVNWLLSREGQTVFQRAGQHAVQFRRILRTDIPKDMVRCEVRRVDGVKYFMAEKPEYMDMAPIQEFSKRRWRRRKRGKL